MQNTNAEYSIFAELRKKVCILKINCIFAIGLEQTPKPYYRSVILLLVTENLRNFQRDTRECNGSCCMRGLFITS